MAAKKKPAPRKKAAAAPHAPHPGIAVAAMAARSLLNMTVVTISCATTLGALMTALKLQLT
jgi:hypothetical protein